MPKNLFANLEMKNNGTTLQHVKMEERRESFLSNPEEYEVSIDRFSIHRANLPMFQFVDGVSPDLKVKVIKRSDSSESIKTLDFTGLVDSDGLMWNIDYFLNELNAEIENACTDVGILADWPTVSVDRSTFIATFDYSDIAGFGDDYYVEFNNPLYCIFDSFHYADVLESNTYLRLYTPNSVSDTISTASAIAISPVDKIVIKTQRIPVYYEYTASTSGTGFGDNVEAILTDYEFSGLNQTNITSINYSASTGQYRLHSMHPNTNFSSADVQFYYKTYLGYEYNLNILPSGSCNLKLYFRKI